ncbi:MAG: glycosyltransferase family 8 protein [Clostridia bacterium]|nr:glycosyltransferase family 8 protein [Clostridia bacterium]
MENKNKKKTNNTISAINVALITDDNYIVPTIVTIQSIVNNTDKGKKYIINILCDNVSKENKQLMEQCKSKNVEIKFINVDKKVFEEFEKETKDIYMVANSSALIKFLLPTLFKSLDKILYLDGDLIVNCDIAEIYNIDLKENFVAAVRDLPQVLLEPQLIGGDISGTEYFNSGVMLLNLKKMRKENAYEKLIKIKKERVNDNLMDQNVFNVVFKDNVHQLDLSYNVCYCNYKSTKRLKYEKLKNYYTEDYSTIEKIAKKAKIIHYSSFLKPWVYYDTPLASLWTKTYYSSPLKSIPLHRASIDGETNISYKKTRERLKQKNLQDIAFSKEIVPIVLCPDHNYAKFAAVTIQSIIDNITSENTEYRVYIFHDEELFLRDKLILKGMSTENVKVECLDVRNLINKEDLYSRAHYSKQMFYRWLIPEVLPQYTKVIYIDCDMVLNNDIKKLYDITIGTNNVIGAVKNRVQDEKMRNYLTHMVKIEPTSYINSGVLVIYTHKFLNENIKEKCLQCLKSNDIFLCPDQDVINIVLQGRIKFIDESWNFQWANLQFTNYDKYNNNHNIIHYTSGVKPWKMNGVSDALAEYFWKYARKTPVYEEIIYSSINFQINKSIRNQNPCVNRKKRKFFLTRWITWPFRTISAYNKDKREKNKEYAKAQNKIRVKYAINRILRRVDIDNNPIVKKKKNKKK